MMNRFKQWLNKWLLTLTMPTALDPTPVEQQYYTVDTYTYKTELQIVLLDKQVVCTDYVYKKDIDYKFLSASVKKYYEELNPVEQHIKNAFENKVLNTFDKSNKYFNEIPTNNIKNILYKPCVVSVESKQVEIKK